MCAQFQSFFVLFFSYRFHHFEVTTALGNTFMLIFFDFFPRDLVEGESKIAELEHMVRNLSRESQDKRELLESIQSDKETISK